MVQLVGNQTCWLSVFQVSFMSVSSPDFFSLYAGDFALFIHRENSAVCVKQDGGSLSILYPNDVNRK